MFSMLLRWSIVLRMFYMCNMKTKAEGRHSNFIYQLAAESWRTSLFVFVNQRLLSSCAQYVRVFYLFFSSTKFYVSPSNRLNVTLRSSWEKLGDFYARVWTRAHRKSIKIRLKLWFFCKPRRHGFRWYDSTKKKFSGSSRDTLFLAMRRWVCARTFRYGQRECVN